ncbi:agmatine/peptidylarginine deiminase [Chloroflexota bacterium]
MTDHSPNSQGYYMPAEWAPHEGTWLQWPHDEPFPGEQIRLESLWLAMTQALQKHETVHIVAKDERHGQHIQNQAAYFGWDERKIDIHVIATDDVWVRDNGPIFLLNDSGELAITAWNFNGWGQRYPFKKDRLVPAAAAQALSMPLFNAPITLEGGALEINGKGTLIATRSSIINPNRNPGKGQAEIEAAIKEYLGIKHIIWLSGASREFCDAVGSNTDLHVDGYARFTDESTVLYSWTDDESNIFYPILKQHREELRRAETESGKPLTIVPLPKPENAMYSTLNTSTRPPFEITPSLAIYANFYIANNIVLLPVYGDITDTRAKSILAEHFPNREIIGLPAHVTAELGGMIHCVTQQQPLKSRI